MIIQFIYIECAAGYIDLFDIVCAVYNRSCIADSVIYIRLSPAGKKIPFEKFKALYFSPAVQRDRYPIKYILVDSFVILYIVAFETCV